MEKAWEMAILYLVSSEKKNILNTQIKALQDKVDTIQKNQADSRNPLISIN